MISNLVRHSINNILMRLYVRINTYAMQKNETYGEKNDYFVTISELEQFFREAMEEQNHAETE